MKDPLTFDTRKSLAVHLGEQAGEELTQMLLEMARRIQHLERSKVDVMPIVAAGSGAAQINVSERRKAR